MKIQLPDLVSEDTAIITFHTSRNKRKLSISEFERAVDKRSSQNLGKASVGGSLLESSHHHFQRASKDSF